MSYAGNLTPEQAWEILTSDPSSVLVDCRTNAEWNYVGVPELSSIGKRTVFIEWISYPDGAANPNFVQELRAAGVTDDQRVLFICRSGHRSIGAAQAATADGVAQAYNILDGFEGDLDADGHRGAAGWRALGLPWRQG
ncbi:rhodanese-like domain-containing protein [Jongsikchunia kroppenstedtii]|uniref:rhodanese-like domain-containing protein n=1 Tax=Jongsikchunia kroppenstedtii TaxID=1121721 RepID=UPI0003730B95|nr:rhodanese-like domain-containing protein [Jongsikchunia kroppenstedtii]